MRARGERTVRLLGADVTEGTLRSDRPAWPMRASLYKGPDRPADRDRYQRFFRARAGIGGGPHRRPPFHGRDSQAGTLRRCADCLRNPALWVSARSSRLIGTTSRPSTPLRALLDQEQSWREIEAARRGDCGRYHQRTPIESATAVVIRAKTRSDQSFHLPGLVGSIECPPCYEFPLPRTSLLAAGLRAGGADFTRDRHAVARAIVLFLWRLHVDPVKKVSKSYDSRRTGNASTRRSANRHLPCGVIFDAPKKKIELRTATGKLPRSRLLSEPAKARR